MNREISSRTRKKHQSKSSKPDLINMRKDDKTKVDRTSLQNEKKITRIYPQFPKKVLEKRRSSWAIMRNVIVGLNALRNTKVELIKNENELDENIKDECLSPTLNKLNSNFNSIQDFPDIEQNMKKLAREDTRNLLNNIKNREYFFILIQNSTDQNLIEISKMIDTDPLRFLRGNNDPERILNKANQNGLTPLYIACLNGNLKTVQLLIKKGADPHLMIDTNIFDSILGVSARWNHKNIVEFLLEIVPWKQKELELALFNTNLNNIEIRKLIEQKINKSLCKKIKIFFFKCFS